MAEVADSLGRIIPVDTLGVYVHQVARSASSARCWPAARAPMPSCRAACPTPAASSPRSSRRARPAACGAAGSDPAALILAPLRGRDRVLGILYLKRRGEDARFDARELDLVRLFAAHASIALQNALTHRAVEIRAQMDALTGPAQPRHLPRGAAGRRAAQASPSRC